MQKRPILKFRPDDHIDFVWLSVPESRLTRVIVIVCALAAGALLARRIRRRQPLQPPDPTAD